MTSFLRAAAPLGLLLPIGLLAAACNGDDTGNGEAPDGGLGSDDATTASSSGGSSRSNGSSGSGGSSGSSGSSGSGGSSGSSGSSGGDASSDSSGSSSGDASSDGEAGTNDAAAGPGSVVLGAAGSYAILAESAVADVPTSVVTGNVGLSPAAASYITGFTLTRAGTMWTTPEVVGGVFAANNDPPTPVNLPTSVASMETAYSDASTRPSPKFLNLGGGAIGGLTLAPGLYRWTSTVTIASDIAIAGAPGDVWIFQVTGDLTMSAAKKMTLSGGAVAKNIFWQVAGAVDFGTTSHAEGIVLSKTAITLETGSSINGRLFAQTAVNVASATVTAPAP